MRSTKLQDALRRSSFDVADRRGNNPHATREAADAEGRRLNGYRYETVAQAERALDRRTQTLGEAPGPPPPSGGGGGNGLFWLLAAGAGIALLSALSSSSSGDDRDDDEADDDDAAPEPMRVNPPPPPMPNITVNLTMPHAPAAALLNPAPFQSSSEPVHITVPIMAPIVMPPETAQATPAPMPSPAAPLLNPAKRRRKK